MKRREFITLVGGAAAWPVVASGQKAMPVIGHMHAGVASANRDEVTAFEQGLKQRGYVRGQNVTIQYIWGEGRYDRLPALASELVDNHVSLIVAGTPVAALAAKRATTSIPIIFHVGSDPVKDGLVSSLNRPGGNITGATFFSNLLTSKRLGLLLEMIPSIKSVVALVNSNNANAQFQTSEAMEASRTLGLQVRFLKASTENEIDKVFEDMQQDVPNALLILSDSFLNGRAAQISALAIRRALPTCFAYREPALAGGLLAYGASRTDNAFLVGDYAGRILKGEKPADLPVLQPTHFNFVINLNTAKAIGLTVPPTLLARADEVIE
jgi:putative ABC transport system substrate-binding protein